MQLYVVIDEFRLLLSIYTREYFLKGKDVWWTCWVRYCMTKLKMLVRNI
jgi:hypothetical protein